MQVRLTVPLPDSLWKLVLDCTKPFELSNSQAAWCIIERGLSRSAAEKSQLRRDHMDDIFLGPYHSHTFSLLPENAAAIDAHQREYNIPFRTEACRELLRLGLDVPEPTSRKTSGYRRTQGSRISSDDRSRIHQWAKEGFSQTQIAQVIGVSRQAVHHILRRPDP